MMSEVYQVLCPHCGTVPLTYEEYETQMFQADERWKCPKCTGVAEFDDEAWEASLEDQDD